MTGKNKYKKLSFDTAKKIVDFALSLDSIFDAVAWEFIGGDPSLEMDLVDQIADYAKKRMYETGHKWFDNYIFNIGTNGILYDSDEFQHFLRKNATHVTVGISIDGNKAKHDLQRVTEDGSGSYDLVVKNIPLWLSQVYNASTKVTFSSDDLKYLADSILHLWDLGLNNIPANVVYEDVWKDGDDILFEEQLKKLADYIIDNRKWKDHSVRFFDRTLGFPLGAARKAQNFCGSGRMLAFDCDGKLFPCVRFYDICQDGQTLCVGDVDVGIDEEKKALLSKTCIGMVNDDECENCSIASGCFSCAGNNFRYTYPHSVYKRTKFNCKMHKANVRVNEYFWDRWIEQNNQPSPHELERKNAYQAENWKLDGAQYLYLMLSDEEPSFCNYSPSETGKFMTKEDFDKAVHFAYNNYMIPVYVGNPESFFDSYSRNKLHIRIERYSNLLQLNNPIEIFLPIFDSKNFQELDHRIEACILSIDSCSISSCIEMYSYLKQYSSNIRIVTPDYWTWSENIKRSYIEELEQLKSSGLFANTDDRNDCRAGSTEFAFCPDGKIYPCPGYYFNKLHALGDCNQGISKDFSSLANITKSSDCMSCNCTSCQRCSLVNVLRHGMPNIPAKIQCEYNLHVVQQNQKL